MNHAVASGRRGDAIEIARVHALLRFSVGITAAFVLAEAMGWSPTFLPPVLFAVLITNLPAAPPFKVGVFLVLVMAAAAFVGFILPSLLGGSPEVLVGAIAIVLFVAFLAMAQGRAKLPATFLLISVSTTPVIGMIAPGATEVLPIALVRAMTVAVLIMWCVHGIWPETVAHVAPTPTAPSQPPVKAALVGTAIVMPVMLVYLLYGIADALPVLVTVVMLVTTFDPRQGAMQGLGMILGNLLGGCVGLIASIVLMTAPSLMMLGVLTFLLGTAFAVRIDKGGTGAAIALLTCNSALIIWSTAIANPAYSSGIWITRLAQFALAWVFAIGMMTLVSRRKVA